MADEFDFHGSAAVEPQQLADFLMPLLGAEMADSRFLRRDRLHVSLLPMESTEEQDPIASLLGFTHRITVTFRFFPSEDQKLYHGNIRAMIEAVLAVLSHFGGDGVLMFNGEYMLIEGLDGSVTFDSEWDGLREVPELATIAHRYGLRRLPQPLL
jgi:hypothetical protein